MAWWSRTLDAAKDASLRCHHQLQLDPGAYAIVGTGVAVAIPLGWKLAILPRSGFGIGFGITAHIGTIDTGYRGEILSRIVNWGQDVVRFNQFDRITQLIMQPHATLMPWTVSESEGFFTTERGTAGLGSTGR